MWVPLATAEAVLTAQYTFHFHPVQSKPYWAAHHHQFSLKQKLDFFRYIATFHFLQMYVTGTSVVIVEFMDIFLGFPPEEQDTTI